MVTGQWSPWAWASVLSHSSPDWRHSDDNNDNSDEAAEYPLDCLAQNTRASDQ